MKVYQLTDTTAGDLDDIVTAVCKANDAEEAKYKFLDAAVCIEEDFESNQLTVDESNIKIVE